MKFCHQATPADPFEQNTWAVLWLLLTTELPALTSQPPTLLYPLDCCMLTFPIMAKNLPGIKDQT